MSEWGAFLIALIGVLATLGSGVGLYLKSRGENKNASTNAKTALDARIDLRVTKQLETAWTRIDELAEDLVSLKSQETRRSAAMTSILRAIAKQWPGPDGPNLDPDDIAMIEETVPYQWIRRK